MNENAYEDSKRPISINLCCAADASEPLHCVTDRAVPVARLESVWAECNHATSSVPRFMFISPHGVSQEGQRESPSVVWTMGMPTTQRRHGPNHSYEVWENAATHCHTHHLVRETQPTSWEQGVESVPIYGKTTANRALRHECWTRCLKLVYTHMIRRHLSPHCAPIPVSSASPNLPLQWRRERT